MGQVIVIEVAVTSQDAAEVERLVTIPIERAIHGIQGIGVTESSATSGFSRLIVFYEGQSTPEAIRQVESAVFAAWEKFSTFATKPVVSLRSSAAP